MADVAPVIPQSSPPDRRLIAQLTNDPKLIRYLENLGIDAAVVNPENFDILLTLIIDVAGVAYAAQGSANSQSQATAEIRRLLQSINSESSALSRLAALVSEIAGQSAQPLDPQVKRINRRVDEIEVQLLDLRPPHSSSAGSGFAPTVVTVTAAYSVTSSPPNKPSTVRANAASGGFTVTLPAAPVALQLVNIKKVDASANVVTVSGGAINIDGSATVAVASQYTNIQVQYNGTTWDVL